MTRVVETVDDLLDARAEMTGSVGLVMTMGALHAGHATLARAAREPNDHVIASVFVNPLQFGPNEDFAKYPRTFDADVALLAGAGVDLVFHPSVEELYPHGTPLVTVSAGPIGTVLEGAARPGHFDGVLTVVNKVFNLTLPERAYFGQKDAQQLIAVRRMVADLDMGIEIVAVPTVREESGLALSSRNVYLSADERERALVLSRSLRAAESAASAGADAAAVRKAGQEILATEPSVQVSYFELLDPLSAQPVPDDYAGQAIAAVAARVGTTRLIDNVPLTIGSPST